MSVWYQILATAVLPFFQERAKATRRIKPRPRRHTYNSVDLADPHRPRVYMRLLVDGVVFENSQQIGVWRVFFEILSRLSSEIDVTLLLRNEPQMPLPVGCRIVQDTARVLTPRRQLARYIQRRLANRYTPRKLGGQDLFHSTFFTPSPLPSIPTVVTVHDMIPESLPYICNGGGYIQQVHRKRELIATSDRIIAISHATAAELSKFYPQSAKRAVVIHHGSEHIGSSKDKFSSIIEPQAQGPYALFVGGRFSYKNFCVVVSALKNNDWPDHLRLFAVGDPLTKEESEYLRSLGIGDRVVAVGRVPDDRLAVLYKGAACFIFPSVMEGFGLPLLEAQNYRCPVICSNIPSFREVAGEAAVFFDPHSPSDLVRAVREATQSETRLRLEKSGIDNLRRFSWDRCAAETMQVYKSVLDKKKDFGHRGTT